MTMFENRYHFTVEDCAGFIRKTEQAKGRPVVWVIGLLLLLEAVLVAHSAGCIRCPFGFCWLPGFC